MKFVIKLFPEITIKSKPVRKRMVVQLRRNIKDVLNEAGIRGHIQGQWDAVEINLSDNSQEDLAVHTLCRIPGIAKVLTVKEHSFETFDDILDICRDTYSDALKGQTFCVRATMIFDPLT